MVGRQGGWKEDGAGGRLDVMGRQASRFEVCRQTYWENERADKKIFKHEADKLE